MTSLNKRKSRLIFETCDIVRERGRYREVVVEAHPMCAHVRLKGMRSGFDIPWSAIWAMAAKAEAERIRREKKVGKK